MSAAGSAGVAGSSGVAGPAVERFGFRFTAAYRLAGLPFAIGPRTAHAELSADSVSVRFGPWRVQTWLQNVVEIELSGPFSLLKTAGPARLAVTDRGLTFATNGDAGVRLGFRDPVGGIEPVGLLRHPELTITVAEPERFATRLRERLAVAGDGTRRGW